MMIVKRNQVRATLYGRSAESKGPALYGRTSDPKVLALYGRLTTRKGPALYGRVATHTGFSTVELLISLFIAAAFVTTAFQLFFVVTKDSNEARLRAQAGSIVSQALKENASKVNDVCSPPPPSSESPGPDDFPNSLLTIDYSCPYGPQARTTRITATLTYDESNSTVRSSLDVSR